MIANRFFNREISWLEFNGRVLEEAEDSRNPLLERVKFLSIFHSNLDEFYMIRVSGLQEQVEAGYIERSRDGLSPTDQLVAVRELAAGQNRRAWQLWNHELQPCLEREGIVIRDYTTLSHKERTSLKRYYEKDIYPILTPLAVDPSHPFPLISNLSLNLAVVIDGKDKSVKFARVKIPPTLPRLVRTPNPRGKDTLDAPVHYAWLEDIVADNLGSLFRKMAVVSAYPFRVIRDTDIEIREDEAGDLLQGIERVLRRRRFGSVARLDITESMPGHIRELLLKHLETDPADCFETEGRLGMSAIGALADIDRPDLKVVPYRPRLPARMREDVDIFETVRAQDVLLHHPFDSFSPVVTLITAAASDPDVLAIKQTIYRVGTNSPVVAALQQASDKGKQVTVIVELKARFDEENNLEWARSLEAAGVHVVYSDIAFKVHCKLLMIVRREARKVQRYIHLSTGNYNARTATQYTDLGLLTSDPIIADDVSALFNALTGYSEDQSYRKLLVSPGGIRKGLYHRIEREIEHARSGGTGRLVFKMNALTDFDFAERLYDASRAGVSIDLIVRGSCCLAPGIPGLSDTIRVRSIVGRFLEHDRVFFFQNGGAEEVYLGSADLMPRNLDRRYEALFPVEDPYLKRWIIDTYLEAYLKDSSSARILNGDGTYVRVAPEGRDPVNAQRWFMERERSYGQEDSKTR